ncbi:MAG: amidohydrolase family protein [Burkholderiales bacterium]|nr:amidohydrolase family protein [Burkholderiales bacterium]
MFLKDYLAMLDALGVARAVIVQSGVHGTNNDVVADAIAQSDNRLKAVALIDEHIADAELARLRQLTTLPP